MTNKRQKTDTVFGNLTIHNEIDSAFRAQLRKKVLETFRQTRPKTSQQAQALWAPQHRGRIAKLGVAIAASLLIGAIGWFAGRRPAASPEVSFSDVVQHVQRMDAVQYHQTVTLAAPDQPTRTITADVINVDAPRWQVVEPNGRVLATQPATPLAPAGQLTVNNPAAQTPASSQPLAQEVFRGWNVIDQMRDLASESVAPARSSQAIGDRPAVTFCVDRDQRTTQVWVDPQTRLPVRVEQSTANKTGSVAASSLLWTPRQDRKATIVHPRPDTDHAQNGKILLVPAGDHVDNMPMVPIPPGCNILIAPSGGNIDNMPMAPTPPGRKSLIPGEPAPNSKGPTTIPSPPKP